MVFKRAINGLMFTTNRSQMNLPSASLFTLLITFTFLLYFHFHFSEHITKIIMMPSAGLLAFLITFTSFNSMQAKHFLVETKDNAEAGKRPNYLRFILGTLPFPSRNPSLKYLLSDLVSQCGPFTRYDQLGPFFVVSVLLVLFFFSAKI